MNLKRKAWTQQQCDDYLNGFKADTQNQVKNICYKQKLNDWLLAFYQTTYLPSSVCTRLQEVYNGTYKSLTKPVPVWDLYDMFTRQEKTLQEINKRLIQKNARRGRSTNAESLFRYDLAVILSKYDSYLEWKAKNLQEQSQAKKSTEEYIDYTTIFPQKPEADNTSININDILDEI